MMQTRFFIILAFFLTAIISVFSQSSDYFQQELHYTMEVTLDDSLHQVDVLESIVYKNNSPDKLEYIYFNLWPNGYLNQETALSQQFIRFSQDRFYFAEAKDVGGFITLNFRSDGKSLDWAFDSTHLDIAKVWLPEPLAPGEKIQIDIPFLLQIPASFSRLGHVEDSYQMTQWYPKPAVYDQEGWHPMPYLDQGEYYSEFGSFDVSITLPENYLVGASGMLQTESEKTFLQEKEKETIAYLEKENPMPIPAQEALKKDTIPASAERQKTIQYIAENVHDFAWFADKRFRVMRRDIAIPSDEGNTSGERIIDGWIFFTLIEEWYWQDALDYLERATIHYSNLVGEYPYPQVTAVQSALSAGGGMEYPMITVIGYSGDPQSLDEVITHEVGHNWFYGILGSNERDHPWMDEGLNSFYDQKYTKAYYGGLPGPAFFLPKFIGKGSDLSFYELTYKFFAGAGKDMAPDTHSDSLFQGAYYLGAYEKPTRVLRHIEGYVGVERFQTAMQNYYEAWKFRHPGPADFQRSLEQSLEEPLDWAFDGFINTSSIQDYRISNIREEEGSLYVTLSNLGKIAGPISIAGMQSDSILHLEWYPGFLGKKELIFPQGDYEKLELDPAFQTLELNRDNNQKRIQKKAHFWKDYRLKLITGVDHSEKKMIYWSPLVAWNDYDKWMVGLALHNISMVEHPIEYAIMPLYSPLSNQLNGLASVHFNAYFRESESLRKLRVGLSTQRFNSSYNWPNNYRLGYLRNQLSARLNLELLGSTSGEKYFQIRGIQTKVDRAVFNDEGIYVSNTTDDAFFIEGKYRRVKKQAVNAWSWEAGLEAKTKSNHLVGAQGYLKAFAEGNYRFTYQRFRTLDFRLFAAGFLGNPNRGRGLIFPWSIDLADQAAGDYLYDDYFIGRSDQTGLWWRQQNQGEGGFYTTLPPAYRTQSGATNNYLIAFNFKAGLPKPLPRKFPLKPFFNAAYSSDKMPFSSEKTFADQLWWETGLTLETFGGRINFTMPLFVSKQMDALLDQNGQTKIFQRFSFRIDFSAFNPIEMREQLDF